MNFIYKKEFLIGLGIFKERLCDFLANSFIFDMLQLHFLKLY